MVVPTYPEGGSHAQPAGVPAPPPGCASRPLCRVVRDSRNTLLATAPADSVETFTVAQRTQCALCDREGGGGGGRSVHACAVFLLALRGGALPADDTRRPTSSRVVAYDTRVQSKVRSLAAWGTIQPPPVSLVTVDEGGSHKLNYFRTRQHQVPYTCALPRPGRREPQCQSHVSSSTASSSAPVKKPSSAAAASRASRRGGGARAGARAGAA